MSLTRKESAAIKVDLAKCLNVRGVDLDAVIKKFAKFWGIARDDDELEQALESKKETIDYICSFEPLEGDDGQIECFKQLAKAKLITLPKSITALEAEDEDEEPARRPRRARDEDDEPAERRPRSSSRGEHKSKRGARSEVDPREIRASLKKEGSVVAAAEALGITRATIYRHVDTAEIAKLCGR